MKDWKVICIVALSLAVFDGCGGDSKLQQASMTNRCDGIIVSGVLRDSLTSQPVTQGMAILESGTEVGPSMTYNFSLVKSVRTDSQGTFGLCASSPLSYPSAVVIEAMDANGNLYPPYTAYVSASTDFGIVSMGGCTLICGLATEQQTARPATISGVINTMPVASAGTVIPRFSMLALDGSKTTDGLHKLWNLALPVFIGEPPLAFSTVAGTCDGKSPSCFSYTFAVPAQSPIQLNDGRTLERATPPSYSIYAAPAPTSGCTPSVSMTAFQQDGKSPLTATEGAALIAQTINFTDCH